jgi:hypothetical protein
MEKLRQGPMLHLGVKGNDDDDDDDDGILEVSLYASVCCCSWSYTGPVRIPTGTEVL